MGDNTGDKLTTQLRESAHTLGTTVAVLWLMVGIGYAILDPWTLTSELIVSFTVFLALGVGIAWWKENIGGVMLIVLSVAFSIFAAVEATHNRILAALLSGVPFLIVGVLFLLAWRRSKKTGPPTSPNDNTSADMEVQGGV